MKTQKGRRIGVVVFIFLAVISLQRCGVPTVESLKKQQLFNNKTIYVYPVHILSVTREESFDTLIAKRIVAFINEQDGFNAKFINRIPNANSEWSINEAKMFKKSFIAFSDFIKTDMQTGEYGFLIEFLILPNEMAMHYYLVDKKENKAVLRQLINSHNPIYQEVKPQNKEEAFELFCRIFKNNINQIKKGE